MIILNNVASLKNIVKSYKDFKLDNISIDFLTGYITGLIGPNGAGKTTALKILMNIVKPDSGYVSVLGMEYKNNEKYIKNKIGYVGEVQYFYEDRTISWTADFVSKFYTDWDNPMFNKYLDEFQINHSKKIKTLSKGMRVKFSLALALSHNPSLIVLDEPTSGLVPIIRRNVLDLLKKTINEDPQKAVIISSHITNDLERIADHVLYLVDGQIMLKGEKDLLLSKWKKIHFKEGILDDNLIKKLINTEKNMFGCSGYTDNYMELKNSLSIYEQNGDVKIENTGLDDILITITGAESK